MRVLGVEDAAGDAVREAGHHLARALRVDHFGGDAQGARLGRLRGAGSQTLLGRVQVEPALLLVAERLAAGHGELGPQLGATASQRPQHRHQGSHALFDAGPAEQQEPPPQRRVEARLDEEGTAAVQQPFEPLAQRSRRRQGIDLAGHDQAGVGIGAAVARAELVALQQGHMTAGLGQVVGDADAYGPAADDQNVVVCRHVSLSPPESAHILPAVQRRQATSQPAGGRRRVAKAAPKQNRILTRGSLGSHNGLTGRLKTALASMANLHRQGEV